MLDKKHLVAFKRFVGSKGWSDDEEELAPHLKDWRGRYTGKTPILLKPSNVHAVARVIEHCDFANIAIVPQGGNTGLVKGGIPSVKGDEVLLSTKRLLGDIIVDTDNNTITALAGTPLQHLHDAAAKHDRTFGLSLASQGSCTAGGVASTNAGGINVLRYGMTRDLIVGLEAVLPNGNIFSDLDGLKKDNTGYNVRDLFIGAEGTLGVITKVMFKLFPAIHEKNVLMVALSDVETAVKLLNQAHALGDGTLNAFEVMPKVTLEMVANHMPELQKPFNFDHPWYAIIEFARSTPDERFSERLETWLETLFADGSLLDGTLAANDAQGETIWAWREAIAEAERACGGSLKHDVSVPINKVPELLARAEKEMLEEVPGAIPVMFGHLGDGNIHLNLAQSPEVDKAAFYEHQSTICKIVYDIVADLGGSFSAEHGVGTLKINELATYKDPVALATMRAIKLAFDPKGIMNPNKLFK